ncbi:MAG: phytoene/squalene synthase family protein [Gammaproteobacteria bacterium]
MNQSSIINQSADLRRYFLDGVSRTFALSIPQLPDTLQPAISIAYLLCRILDTVEDEAALSMMEKQAYLLQLVDCFINKLPSQDLALSLGASLSTTTTPIEKELIAEMQTVLDWLQAIEPRQQAAILDCIQTMGLGMADFLPLRSIQGLNNTQAFDQYCYTVAGVVGEMLTTLFCQYSEDINQNRDQLMPLSISFGQGLQMTNILKDIWADHDKGVCWLPQSLFSPYGLDLSELASIHSSAEYQMSLRAMVEMTSEHLENAVRYIKLIPKKERGIRKFCFWAAGMGMLTLRNIYNQPGFRDGRDITISRHKVKATIAVSQFAATENHLLDVLLSIFRIKNISSDHK